MGDITLRALETLKEVDLILCEDTRETGKILAKFGIKKPTMSYHAQSKLSKTDKIFELLEEGKNLALVSDAGTPGISDPGALLVSKIKAHLSHGVDVIPIPGPSAVIAALSASGFPRMNSLFSASCRTRRAGDALQRDRRIRAHDGVLRISAPHIEDARIAVEILSGQTCLPGSRTDKNIRGIQDRLRCRAFSVSHRKSCKTKRRVYCTRRIKLSPAANKNVTFSHGRGNW